MAVVPSPGVRVTVAEFLIRDHGRVSECCDFWRIKLNASNIKTMSLWSPPLTIGGTVLKESDDLVILGVPFDSKMTSSLGLPCFARLAMLPCGLD